MAELPSLDPVPEGEPEEEELPEEKKEETQEEMIETMTTDLITEINRLKDAEDMAGKIAYSILKSCIGEADIVYLLEQMKLDIILKEGE